MTEAIILSGDGRYADPWHPYAQTSACLAHIVSEVGLFVEVCDDVDVALARLGHETRLIVVNAGDPTAPRPNGADGVGERDDAVVSSANRALEAAMRRGIGVLALHAASASLRDYPAYGRALGARWVRGRSWHPPIGNAVVHMTGDHPVARRVDDFSVFDERYLDFEFAAQIEPIATFEHDGTRHPVVWARETGRSRLVYDALGHDARSYDSEGHCALIRAAVSWLTDEPERAPK